MGVDRERRFGPAGGTPDPPRAVEPQRGTDLQGEGLVQVRRRGTARAHAAQRLQAGDDVSTGIVLYPDPVLARKARPAERADLTPELRKLLLYKMTEADG